MITTKTNIICFVKKNKIKKYFTKRLKYPYMNTNLDDIFRGSLINVHYFQSAFNQS